MQCSDQVEGGNGVAGFHRFFSEVLFIIIMLHRAFMRQRGLNCSRWSCETVTPAHQEDATSCGVIVCKVSERALNQSFQK